MLTHKLIKSKSWNSNSVVIMSMLMMLKEGGSLLIDTIGNLPIDEDIDLLPETGSLELYWRVITDSISVTSSTSSKSRAIVMGV